MLAYRSKADLWTQRWREKAEELTSTYLKPLEKPELAEEDLTKLSQALATKLSNQPSSPEDQKLLFLAVGWILDGSTLPLADLASQLRTLLAELGAETNSLVEGWPDLLITALVIKEDLTYIARPPNATHTVLPSHFWQTREFPDSLPQVYSSRSSLRSKLIGSLESLSKLLITLAKSGNTLNALQKLTEQEKKYIASEQKVEKERERQKAEEDKRRKEEEKREEKRKAEETKKEEKRRAEDEKRRAEEEKKRVEEEKKRADEEKKEEKRRAEEEKKRVEEEKKEEKRKADEEKKEEKKRLDEEKKRLEEARKEEKRKLEEERKRKEEEEKKKKTGPAITRFFQAVPKEATSLNASGIDLQEEGTEGGPGSIWKKGLGQIPRYSEWSEERCENFVAGLRNCLSDTQNRPSIALLRRDLKEQLADLQKPKSSQFLEGEMMDEELPHQARKVFIKYEDYLFDSFEYRGLIKRKSAKIRSILPFAKDEELLDYEISSDDELELQEEAESINSKEDDAGEEEEDQEDVDDFVVPDGYLSASEVESLDGQDKQKLVQRKANQKNLVKKLPHHYDFTSYVKGEDCTMDVLAERLRAIPIMPLSFPLAIEIEPEVIPGAPELTDEQLVDIVRSIHCCSNKLEEVEKLKKKFGNIPKSMIKNKVDDITTAGILVDPDLYERNSSNMEDYLRDIAVLFLKRDEEEEVDGVGIPAETEVTKKEKLTRGGEKLEGDRLWNLAKCLNGTREGLTKKENKTLTEFQRKHTTLTRREIDRRAKEVALNLYLVDPMVFESLVNP